DAERARILSDVRSRGAGVEHVVGAVERDDAPTVEATRSDGRTTAGGALREMAACTADVVPLAARAAARIRDGRVVVEPEHRGELRRRPGHAREGSARHDSRDHTATVTPNRSHSSAATFLSVKVPPSGITR